MPPEPQVLPPANASSTRGPLAVVLIAGVRGYQALISPALHALAGPGCGCRFTPSCSHYAIQALGTHGAIVGSALTARRLMRCQPWGGSGFDPVPPRKANPATA